VQAAPFIAPETTSADAPDVSVVIVSYNVRAFLEQALASVAAASKGLHVETFVVDNASVDGTPEAVRAHFPGVHVIANTDNVGFSRANNQALRLARGRHVLILNPDTILEEGTLHTLAAFLDAHPDAGAVGPMLLNPDGTFAPESRRAFPTPEVAFYRMSGLSHLFPRHPRFGRYNLTHLHPDTPTEVDALSGACMMVRRQALWEIAEKGTSDEGSGTGRGAGADSARPSSPFPLPLSFFDEGFFMYGEDLDLCYRLQKAGWRIHYTPDTRIVHYKGESTKKGELRYVRLFYGAMLRFAEKHFSGDRGGALLVLGLRAAIFGRALVSAAGQASTRLKAPSRDAVLALCGLTLAAMLRVGDDPAALGLRFFGTVGAVFVLATVLGIALAGGYRPGGRARYQPVAAGVLAALAAVSTLSFFVKTVAFSRVVVLGGTLLTALLLGAHRLAVRQRQPPRRALVVGTAEEAVRLAERLDAQRRPPFVLAGYLHDRRPRRPGRVPHLGPVRALRDLVRFEGASDVLFSATSLPASTAFALVQTLHDLPVECRMFAPDGARVIGKASVDELGLVEAERVV
jgi:O-antigen biosynthesis protein